MHVETEAGSFMMCQSTFYHRTHLDDTIAGNRNANGVEPGAGAALLIDSPEVLARSRPEYVVATHQDCQVVLLTRSLDLLVHHGVVVLVGPHRLEIVAVVPLAAMRVEVHLDGTVPRR